MSTPLNLASTGNFGPAFGTRLGNMSLVGGSAAATATIRDGGSGGTIVRQMAAALGTMEYDEPTSPDGYTFVGQPHLTITGAGASLNVELL